MAAAFAAFFLIGAVLSDALFNSSSLVKTLVLIVLAPAALAISPIAVWQALWKVRRLLRALTTWHVLWFLIFASALIFRIRSSADIQSEVLDTGALYRLGIMTLVGLALVTLLVLRRTDFPHSMLQGVLGLYATYVLFGVLSSVWSIFPAWSAYKASEILVDTALIAAIVSAMRNDWEYKSIFDLTYCLYGGLLVTTWAGAVLAPSLAFHPSRGIISVQLFGPFPYVHTNSVGEYGAIIAVVSVIRLYFAKQEKRRRAFYYFTLALGLASLIMSQTRTAEIGFVCALMLGLFFLSPKKAMTYGGLATVAVAFTGLSELLLKFFARGQSTAMLESATGRVKWWEAAWRMVEVHPVIGSGAFAAGRWGVLAKIDPNPANVHNSYLEVLVGTGAIGLLIVLSTLVWIWWIFMHRVRRSASMGIRRQLVIEASSILALLTVRSAFSGVIVMHAPMFFLLLLGFAEYVRRTDPIRVTEKAHARQQRVTPVLQSSEA
jgi:hypothetical protein